ncbi:single-stranded-DNA-specific exonuclease RecJ [Limnochorda pilosa]|uniref:Single-stranded-DNA-specific exonuclease RecJ n=1 Tax=Limnochorda pilosa TaxID=1555112 RepID=A0A0K2SNQ5_LIMPI|nr:single-stranded-DNA-specific exonuclease RecJ [Limnochorda pilosa]BAS28464.1 single-stranded-DNA-specific exonuclease RecJ [Limnochorda pilosa]
MSLPNPEPEGAGAPRRRRRRAPGAAPEWLWPEPLEAEARERAHTLERHLGLHPLVAEILVRRGLDDPEAAYRFLHPSLDELESPLRLPDMDAAVQRIERALEREEPIWVYGDYDVDGQTGTALLVTALRALGAQVAYHVPNRLSEGYGLHGEALLELRARGAAVVVSVDCGTTASEEVAQAARAGLDVVVTDHHQIPPELPRAVAVVNPRRLFPEGGEPPWAELSGAGVAWKLAQALLERAGRGEEARALLDLAALGTVADVVPLVGENRVLVAHGLSRLTAPSARPGLALLLDGLGLREGPVTPGHVAFQVAPRLNAAGRVEDASLGVRLLLARTPGEAAPLVEVLEQLNRERQALEEQILEEAREQALEAVAGGAVSLVTAGEGWHPGVVGIVASRLVEEFYRPALVIGLEGDEGRGSARSVVGFHLYDALAACRAHLIRFGGHAMAAGFSVAREAVPALREAFEAVTRERLGPRPLRPQLQVECLADPCEVDESLLAQVERLGPFGVGNPAPLLGTPEVPALVEPVPGWGEPREAGGTEAGPRTGEAAAPSWRRVGREGEHVKGAVPLLPSGRSLEAIGFHLAERVPETGGWVDVAYQPTRDRYQGAERLQLRLREVRPSPQDEGDGWAALAAWIAGQAVQGPLLAPEGPGAAAEVERESAALRPGTPVLSGRPGTWETPWELVDGRGAADGLPDPAGPAAFLTPDLWEAVEVAQALRWRLKGAREGVAFLGPLDGELACLAPPPYRPAQEAPLAVALDGSVLGSSAGAGARFGTVILWTPPWTLEGWKRLGEAVQGRRVELRFSRPRVQRLQTRVEMLHPGRQRLAALYRYLSGHPGRLEPRDAARELSRASSLPFSARTVREGLAVLAEVGLLAWEEEAPGGGVAVRLAPHPGRKLDLGRSVRYTRGILRKQQFAAISEIALFGGLARMQDLLRGGAGPWTSSG